MCAVFTHNNGLCALKSVSFLHSRADELARLHGCVKKTQTVRNLESYTFLGSQTRFEGKTQIPILPPRITTSNKTKPTITINVDNQRLLLSNRP
jgi:hypothetical protein